MIAKWILLRRAALAHAIAQDEILKNSFADGTRRMPSDGALGRSQGAADPANCCTHTPLFWQEGFCTRAYNKPKAFF